MRTEKSSTALDKFSVVTALYSTTVNPWETSHSNCFFLEFSKSIPSACTNAKIRQFTWRPAVISLFNWRTEPAQRFLGFLYRASTSSISSFIFSKSEYRITASPLKTNFPINPILKGIFSNVLALLVTTSPISPFPRVTAFCKIPFSYVSTTVRPSNFQDKSPFWSPSHSCRASTSLVLSKDSIGMGWASLGSSLKTSYPTF